MMPRWMIEAQKYLGIHEIKGPKHEQLIVDMFADAGFPGVRDDETAWCAAYVGAILKRVNIAPSKSLMARSYEKWGVQLRDPIYGCVGVKTRVGGGHVGFVVAASEESITLLGGNQGDCVSVALFPRKDFTAFRWPAGEPTTTVALPQRASAALTNATEA